MPLKQQIIDALNALLVLAASLPDVDPEIAVLQARIAVLEGKIAAAVADLA